MQAYPTRFKRSTVVPVLELNLLPQGLLGTEPILTSLDPKPRSEPFNRPRRGLRSSETEAGQTAYQLKIVYSRKPSQSPKAAMDGGT